MDQSSSLNGAFLMAFTIAYSVQQMWGLSPMLCPQSLETRQSTLSIVDYWIFDSNYKQALFMTRESLDLIVSPFFGEEKVVKFEAAFYTVRYLWSPGNLKIG